MNQQFTFSLNDMTSLPNPQWKATADSHRAKPIETATTHAQFITPETLFFGADTDKCDRRLRTQISPLHDVSYFHQSRRQQGLVIPHHHIHPEIDTGLRCQRVLPTDRDSRQHRIDDPAIEHKRARHHSENQQQNVPCIRTPPRQRANGHDQHDAKIDDPFTRQQHSRTNPHPLSESRRQLRKENGDQSQREIDSAKYQK
jgi:hypothetical protein